MPRTDDQHSRLDADARTTLSGPAYEWPLWATTMRVVTSDPRALPSARRLVDRELAHVDLDETHHTVLVPRGLELELDLVARAWAADRCAAVVADVLGVGVLVSIGGDIATAGPAGGGAWEVLVGDGPAGSGALVAVPTGLAVVTSRTATGGALRQATVVAASCVSAATWAAAALTGGAGLERLRGTGLPGRLVGVDGTVAYAGDWPPDGELLTAS
jgi:thiamine biosynthesis lipoprotein